MTCPLCKSDPQPQNFAQPRLCAFDSAGHFMSCNWMCLTMLALRDCCDYRDRCDDAAGSIGVIRLPDLDWRGFDVDDVSPRGYLVLTWDKDRGATPGAKIMCEGEPDMGLTLSVAQQLLECMREKEGVVV